MSRIDELIAEHCPNGVEHVPLREVCDDFIVPMRDRPKAFDGDIPWCRIEDIEGTSLNGSLSGLGVTEDVVRKMNLKVVPTGTVIAACSASLGNYAIATRPLITNQTFIGLVCGPRLYNRYLLHLMFTKTAALKMASTTGTIAYVSRKKFEGLTIPVPSLEVQHEIVRILDTFSKMEAELEAELEARKQQYEHYQHQVFNDLRNSGVNLVPLSEIGRWYGGGTPSKSESSYWTNGSIPWISPKDMGSPIVTQTEDYITNEAVSQSSTKLVPKDSIAIVVRSSILEHTLPIAFVPIESSLNQDMKAVIPAEGISARYVFHAMRAARNDILRQVKRTGGSVASLDSKKLWKFEIPVPDMKEQEHVNQFFDRFDALTNDLSAGLPAELVARRQQYEYYRDKLLAFKELEPAS